MTDSTAKHILLSLLAEKNKHLPEDSDMRELIAGAIDCELMPGGLTRSLEEIFTATVSDIAANNASGKTGETKN